MRNNFIFFKGKKLCQLMTEKFELSLIHCKVKRYSSYPKKKSIILSQIYNNGPYIFHNFFLIICNNIRKLIISCEWRFLGLNSHQIIFSILSLGTITCSFYGYDLKGGRETISETRFLFCLRLRR